jgi:hypothetical protein
MDFQSIERSLLQLIQIYARNFPAEQTEEMAKSVHAGEPGIAFEDLCTQLYEYDVPVDEATLREFKEIGSQMGIQPEYWERLTA